MVIGKSFGIPKEDSNVQHVLNRYYMCGIILNILYVLNNSILTLTFLRYHSVLVESTELQNNTQLFWAHDLNIYLNFVLAHK